MTKLEQEFDTLSRAYARLRFNTRITVFDPPGWEDQEVAKPVDQELREIKQRLSVLENLARERAKIK